MEKNQSNEFDEKYSTLAVEWLQQAEKVSITLQVCYYDFEVYSYRYPHS